MEYIFKCFYIYHNELQPREISNCIAYYLTIKFILSYLILSYLIILVLDGALGNDVPKEQSSGDAVLQSRHVMMVHSSF